MYIFEILNNFRSQTLISCLHHVCEIIVNDFYQQFNIQRQWTPIKIYMSVLHVNNT